MSTVLGSQAGLQPAGFCILEHADCGVCGSDDPEPMAVGADFEDRAARETYLMVRCRVCDHRYLNPRPASGPRETGAPAPGFARRLWRRRIARRLLSACREAPVAARMLEIECGDGYDLEAVREFGARAYRLDRMRSGAPVDARAGDRERYDVAFLTHVLETSAQPAELLAQLSRSVRPHGRVIVVTHNARALDARLFGRRYWGGYAFPRRYNIFTQSTLARLAEDGGWRIVTSVTIGSPFTWLSSLRNVLLDARATERLAAHVGSNAPLALFVFGLLDALAARMGAGTLRCTTLERGAVE